MTTFVILTDEPEKIRRVWGAACDWTVTSFESAADALYWERQMRGKGAVALEGQGYHFGVSFGRTFRAQRPAAAGSHVVSGGA